MANIASIHISLARACQMVIPPARMPGKCRQPLLRKKLKVLLLQKKEKVDIEEYLAIIFIENDK